MIWQMIKKQILIFLRNPSQIQLLIGMPILFVGILGFALGGFLSGDSASSLELDVAIIDHGDHEKQVEQFIQDIDKNSEEEAVIREKAAELSPTDLLKNGFGDVMRIDSIEASKKEHALDEGDYTAIVEIPEQFTYDILNHVFLDKTVEIPAIEIYQDDGALTLVEDAFKEFQEQLALMSVIEDHDISWDAMDVNTDAIKAETISVSHGGPVSSTSYYTIGMAVMYVLFVATLTGFWSFYEKKVYVFNRVIIGNVSRWTYLFGLFFTGSFLAYIHLCIVFTISLLFYGIPIPLLGFLVVTLGVSLAVGGLTALLAAVSYRMDSQKLINLFGSFIVYIFGFIGGSFFPIGDFSRVIDILGNATPNGAGMTAYLTIMRGGAVTDVLPYLLSLLVFGGIMLLGAMVTFPKRGVEI